MRTLVLTGLIALCASAQTPSEPPTLIQVIRKPGLDARLTRPYARIQAPLTVLGMTAMTGVPETWLVEMHDSFASIEGLDQALIGETRRQLEAMDSQTRYQEEIQSPPRTMIALYRPNWSYRASEAVKLLPRAHYFYVSMYRIRPGSEGEFTEAIRQRRAIFDVMNLDRPELAYQVFSGVPTGTFLFLAPLASLKPMDEALTKSAPEGPGKSAAEGELSREHFLLRVEPAQSYVSEEFANVDAAFWKGKAQ